MSTRIFPNACLPSCLAAALLCTSALPAGQPAADAVVDLPELAVIAHAGTQPLGVELDPRAPAQPIPAQDGAEILRAIPGFNVIRKGGTDGDPVLRGMAGSRLGILIDGENILGGCGMRMDPPTAYVFPAAFDRVTILKGPQTVLHGPVASAGMVRFERLPRVYAAPALDVTGALTVGAHDRRDGALELRGGTPQAQFQLTGTWSESGDYRDGAGRRIPSAYERWSLNAAVGWTPDEHTLLELTGIRSDARAAYADRAMDGVRFDRDNVGLRFRRTVRHGWLEAVEARLFYNYIDHVMDNFTLRPLAPGAAMANPAVANPDRETTGGRAAATLRPASKLTVTAGADWQANRHSLRRSMNEAANPYAAQPRLKDAGFSSWGMFAEAAWELDPTTRIVGGLRVDSAWAEDARGSIAVGMGSMPNPTAGQTRRDTLPGGFLRYEHTFGAATVVHAGLGHARRFPDYWELFNKEAPDSISAFRTQVEKTTQLDLGMTHRAGRAQVAVAVFANRVDDYILVQSAYQKPAMAGTRSTTVTRPVATRALGGEASLGYRLGERWLAEAALAYVRGDNRSDDLPLAQQPPLEGRLSLRYTEHHWSAGGLLRMVARQNRFALNQGNIVGQDLGPTPGFAVLSLHASWRPTRWGRLTAGVDNVLDKVYAEHLSRSAAMVAGFPPPDRRVNEPGRTWWITWNLAW